MTAADPATQTDDTLQPDATRPDVEHTPRRKIYLPLDEIGLAIRKAWLAYIVLALIPPSAMIAAIFFLIFTGNDRIIQSPTDLDGTAGMIWTIAGLTWVGLSLPLAFFIRRGLWAAYYEGGVVKPDNYLKGWLVIWLPLVFGGVLGFIGLAATREVASLFTSMLAFIVFLAMVPNGHALTRPVGDHDDPGVYEEPR